MFQFTTTNVLNSLKDLTTGKDLITTVDASGKEEVMIKRIGNFKKANVESIHHTAGSEAELAAVCMDLTNVVSKDKKYRLNMYIGLTQGSADSRYANDLYHKGKAFSIDFEGLATAADVAAGRESVSVPQIGSFEPYFTIHIEVIPYSICLSFSD